MARVRWRGAESVHDDVGEWQTEALPPVFELAKEILLGRRKQALAMLPGLMEQGEISKRDLETWPLFDSIRDDPAFRRLAAS